ncbi:amidohydrolase family protein [Bradyrhizobium sp. MOS003]|uniref:amidohydrolase family protein n=1 Tax=Bradyrhizobium sp. MOS003 TaxID=2133946 RepID=UPI0032DFCD75
MELYGDHRRFLPLARRGQAIRRGRLAADGRREGESAEGLTKVPLCSQRRVRLRNARSWWRASISDVAKCENVVVKLGGLAMCLLGYDFHLRERPPTSEELAAAWRPYVETCIEAFGPKRAMFESNFPPDKGQCSYQVIFNAFKRIASPLSEAEKTALFSQTATDVYRLQLPS